LADRTHNELHSVPSRDIPTPKVDARLTWSL